MRKTSLLFAVLMLLLASSLVMAQTVNVTIRLNTSTVPDTVGSNAVVQLRGDTPPLTWGNDTGGILNHVGGDYWEATLAFPENATVQYKFFVNAQGDGNGNGWETNVNTGSTNRELHTATSDTTLPVLFFNTVNGGDQLANPWQEPDSVEVWFRVNVARLVQDQVFDPAVQSIGVRGGTSGLSWGNTIIFNQESNDDNNQFGGGPNFFSGRVVFPGVTPGDTVFYKFVYGVGGDPNNNGNWESDGLTDPGVPNRFFVVPTTMQDTTLRWQYWNNNPPLDIVGNDTATVLFRADMTRALNENGFSLGDTLLVRWGFNGSGNIAEDTLVQELGSNVWSNLNPVEVSGVQAGGDPLQYQYYLVKRGAEEREIFFDFFDGSGSNSQERRKLTIPASIPPLIQVDDVEDSESSMRRMPRFRNTSPVSQAVTVTYTVDMRPAYYQVLIGGDTLVDIQGQRSVFPGQQDSIFTWGVWMNGPGSEFGDWVTWGATLENTLENKMWDDGSNGGDVTAGDSVYSVQVFYSPESSDLIGQVFKFGIRAGDNEGGFGNNHVENVDDSAPNTFIHSQWGSIDPLFYWVWDFDNGQLTGIEDGDVNIIRTPVLEGNYPNPFNPVTTIRFKLPQATKVSLVIYNALGQKVISLLNGKQPAGSHIVRWNGRDQYGQTVGSGLYFYRLKTNSYEKTMKMVLLK